MLPDIVDGGGIYNAVFVFLSLGIVIVPVGTILLVKSSPKIFAKIVRMASRR